MGRVLPQEPPLLERLHHQRDVALLEVAHAAVHELGGAARRALAEIALLEQQHVVAARGRVDGHAHAGGAAADDHHVPGLGAGRAARPSISARFMVHALGSQPFDRSRASVQRARSLARPARAASSARTGAPPATGSAISSRLFQKPTAEAGQVGGAEGRRLRHRGADHRHAEEVGLELHQQVVARGAAVHAQLRERARRNPPASRRAGRPTGRRSPPARPARCGRRWCRG